MRFRFHFFDTLASTNDTAREKFYRHGDVIVADAQTAGRGQRGNVWSSSPGLNLMFSVVLEPVFLPAAEQFRLLQCVALSLSDMFGSYGLDARIKWTNDIYVGDRKIVGVLMEQSLRGGYMDRCVVGIGINVNQRQFEPWVPNPTSMSLETGREFDCRQVLDAFCVALDRRYGRLCGGEADVIAADYLRRMYRLDTESGFVLPTGERVTGTVRGVGPCGELIVEFEGGVRKSFLFSEIRFVI